jgi:hypothetical protein
MYKRGEKERQYSDTSAVDVFVRTFYICLWCIF